MKLGSTSILALAMAIGSAGALSSETHMTSGLGANSGTVDTGLSDQFIRAENIIGADIYTQYMDYDEGLWNETEYYDEVNADWEEVGEISDIVISRDGKIMGVIAEVGGWLDIGDADVVIDIADLKSVGGSSDSGWGDLAFVTPLSEEQLESRKDVDDGWW